MPFFRTLSAALLALSPISAASAQTMTPPPLEYYAELPSVVQAKISPSGQLTALLGTVQGERVVLVFDAAGTPVKQLALGEAKVRSIEWVGEHAILVLRNETGDLPRRFRRASLSSDKIEWTRGNVIPLDDNRGVVSVFADQRNIVNAIMGNYGVRQVDGKWLGYFSSMRRGNSSGERGMLLDDGPALFAVDLSTGETDLVSFASDWPTLRSWLVDDDGEIGARLELDADLGNWEIKNGDGRRIANGRQRNGEIRLHGFDADGASVIYSEYDEEAGITRRYSVPLSGGESTEVWTQIGLERFVYKPYSSRILGVQLTDDTIELAGESEQQRMSDALSAFSFASSAFVTDWTPDFGAMIAKTSGNYDSGTWFRIDGESGARSIIGLERPAIQGQVIGKISTVSYKAQDGLEIEGILTLPPGREASNLPVVILPHGGPTSHDIEEFDWWAQALASRGYAVFQPNFRGSTGRGREFVNAGDGEWGRAMQTDLSDGLAALAEQGIVDPSRACIAGWSYGGYAALAGVTLQNGIYRCAVSINGVSDVEQIRVEERTYRRSVINRSLDRLFGKDANLVALSPTRNADKADAPILLVHGRNDTVVPISHAAKMLDALKDAGKLVEYIEIAGEDHSLSSSEARKQMLDASVAFIMKHNPPD